MPGKYVVPVSLPDKYLQRVRVFPAPAAVTSHFCRDALTSRPALARVYSRGRPDKRFVKA